MQNHLADADDDVREALLPLSNFHKSTDRLGAAKGEAQQPTQQGSTAQPTCGINQDANKPIAFPDKELSDEFKASRSGYIQEEMTMPLEAVRSSTRIRNKSFTDSLVDKGTAHNPK
jgi:hypothetical protein